MSRSALLLSVCISVGAALGACSDEDTELERDLGLDRSLGDTRARLNEPFGRLCTTPNAACKDTDIFGYKLYCVVLANMKNGSTTKGYCTRACSDVGTECYGVPNGQMASCIVGTKTGDDAGTGTKYCGFLCKTSTNNYDCPPSLACLDSSLDSGTSYSLCMAKDK